MSFRIVTGSASHRALVSTALVGVLLVVAYVPIAPDVGWTPLGIATPTRVGQLNHLLAYVVALLGLELVTGYSGQMCLGQSAFIGLGAYTTMILVTDHGWSQLAALPVVVVCLAAGLVVGAAGSRIRGVSLAVVTLSAAYAFPPIVLRLGWLTGGTNGKGPPRGEGRLRPPSWFPSADEGRWSGPLWVYAVCLVIAIVAFVMTRNLTRSAVGRALEAVQSKFCECCRHWARPLLRRSYRNRRADFDSVLSLHRRDAHFRQIGAESALPLSPVLGTISTWRVSPLSHALATYPCRSRRG